MSFFSKCLTLGNKVHNSLTSESISVQGVKVKGTPIFESSRPVVGNVHHVTEEKVSFQVLVSQLNLVSSGYLPDQGHYIEWNGSTFRVISDDDGEAPWSYTDQSKTMVTVRTALESGT